MKAIKKTTLKIILFLFVFFTVFIYYYLEFKINPTLQSICEVRAKVLATESINEAIKDELQKDNLKEQLIVSTFDNSGRITMINTNTSVMNVLSANITYKVQEKIKDISNEYFTIPLGTALNSQLLADMGPNLTFKIRPQGSVLVDFITEFEESGINQTRYKIYITVSINIRVISPSITSDLEVNNNVLLSEIVIVGDVPESYTQFPITNR